MVRLGVVRPDGMIDVAALAAGTPLGPATASLLALIDAGPAAWDNLRQAVDAASAAPRVPLADVRWHAPIGRPRKNVMCLGLNYAAHARESALARGREVKLPEAPVIFTKAPTTVNGPFADVPVDRGATSQVDWEVELGVIVGRTGRNIAADRALDHVFGYTAINDVTARDLQQRHVQFFKGKSLDGFCPMGPMVVTADEFGDPQAKRLTCRVNGVVKQDGSTSDMIFPVRSIHRMAVARADHRSRRHHRHRDAGRRRHGAHAAGVSPGRRRARDRSGRHWADAQPHRRVNGHGHGDG